MEDDDVVRDILVFPFISFLVELIFDRFSLDLPSLDLPSLPRFI